MFYKGELKCDVSGCEISTDPSEVQVRLFDIFGFEGIVMYPELQDRAIEISRV